MVPKLSFEVLDAFARFGREQKLSLRDPKSIDAFTDSVHASLTTAIESDAWLHGQRTQKMFEALLVSLGQCALLKTEDSGLVHPQGKYIAPDFRVVLKDGTQWLIEVKNVYDADPSRQRFRCQDGYLQKLQDYSSLTGCPLKIALYWARWSIWTLIDPSDLQLRDGKQTIDMFRAAQINEFGHLGDRTVGTEPPLKLRLFADPSKARSIETNGEARLTVLRAGLFSADRELTDPLDQEIAWMFMQYGEWVCSTPKAVFADGELQGIDYVFEPSERPNRRQRFEIVGTLSRVFSQYYASKTLNDAGVVHTEAPLVPDWFAPLTSDGHLGRELPLWLFTQMPNRAPPDSGVLPGSGDAAPEDRASHSFPKSNASEK